jgi:hypothetical protein
VISRGSAIDDQAANLEPFVTTPTGDKAVEITVNRRFGLPPLILGTYPDFRSGIEDQRSNLREADLSGADLSGANLSEADLSEADLIGANLRRANLRGADLSGANLREADLSEANLNGANLYRANLYRANLRGANLNGANLNGANLSEANLREANLREADLSGADLSGANLSEADLSEADLIGANLSGANLSRTLGLPLAPAIPSIDSAILAALEAGGALDMRRWHTCATTHCRAGWAIALAGDAGRDLESQFGPGTAGALIYAASRPGIPVPNFFANNDGALTDMRTFAAK